MFPLFQIIDKSKKLIPPNLSAIDYIINEYMELEIVDDVIPMNNVANIHHNALLVKCNLTSFPIYNNRKSGISYIGYIILF